MVRRSGHDKHSCGKMRRHHGGLWESVLPCGHNKIQERHRHGCSTHRPKVCGPCGSCIPYCFPSRTPSLSSDRSLIMPDHDHVLDARGVQNYFVRPTASSRRALNRLVPPRHRAFTLILHFPVHVLRYYHPFAIMTVETLPRVRDVTCV
jgi:hypothetical protein